MLCKLCLTPLYIILKRFSNASLISCLKIESWLISIYYTEIMGLEKTTHYHSFLLRLWRVKEEHRYEWRASIENIESGEKRGFTSLIELQEYLAQMTTSCDENMRKGI